MVAQLGQNQVACRKSAIEKAKATINSGPLPPGYSKDFPGENYSFCDGSERVDIQVYVGGGLREMRKKRQPTDCDLLRYLGTLERKLRSSPKGSSTLTKQSFPKLPSTIASSAIEVRKSFHFIDDCYRTDVLNFRAEKATYRCFGLAVLAVVFCPELPQLEIELTNEETEIKSIRVSYAGTTPRAVYNYLTMPHSFQYSFEVLEENPWKGDSHDRSLPDFKLQYSGQHSWEHWDERDAIVGFGNDDASVRLASMLLSFGEPANKRAMVKLETNAGYGGVSRLSAEVRFHLPSSKQWPLTKQC